MGEPNGDLAGEYRGEGGDILVMERREAARGNSNVSKDLRVKDLFNQYKYKIGYALSLIAAIFITSASIQVMYDNSNSGEPPNIFLHVLAFGAAIGLVVFAIFFRAKNS